MRLSSPWWRAPLLGAAIGFPILGAGGRLAMRTIAAFTDAASVISVQGTITVLLAGTASGVAGAVFYALLDWRLPARRAMRALLFAAFLVFVTMRGLHPVALLPLALFGPLVAIYGVLLEHYWYRVRLAEPAREANVAA